MFIGREKELNMIEKRISSSNFEFGLVYGRRRIGKTKILQEIVSRHNAIYYVANEMGIDYNLKQLSSIISKYYNEYVLFDEFENLFKYMASKDRAILIIDEFTYLINNNKELLSVFQNCIDQYLINSNIKIILSGSHIGMIEDAISYHKPLYGRSTFKIKVEPFDYFDSAKFYPKMSNEDKVRLYSVFGGVPFYNSKIDDTISVKENIINLIIEEGSIFADEITFFLTQEVRSVYTYGRILNSIASGATKLNEISSKSNTSNSGTISKYIELLVVLGIVEKEYCYGEKSNSKKTIYRLKDQLFKFYYTFIEKNKTSRVLMNPNTFYDTIVKPYLDEYVSLEFENICKEFLKRENIETIQEIGRYWYNDVKLKQNIEIDLIMKDSNNIYAFECKWTNSKIDNKELNLLIEKTTKFNKIRLGFFSKSGYGNKLDSTDLLLYNIDDLYAFKK